MGTGLLSKVFVHYWLIAHGPVTVRCQNNINFVRGTNFGSATPAKSSRAPKMVHLKYSQPESELEAQSKG